MTEGSGEEIQDKRELESALYEARRSQIRRGRLFLTLAIIMLCVAAWTCVMALPRSY